MTEGIPGQITLDAIREQVKSHTSDKDTEHRALETLDWLAGKKGFGPEIAEIAAIAASRNKNDRIWLTFSQLGTALDKGVKPGTFPVMKKIVERTIDDSTWMSLMQLQRLGDEKQGDEWVSLAGAFADTTREYATQMTLFRLWDLAKLETAGPQLFSTMNAIAKNTMEDAPEAALRILYGLYVNGKVPDESLTEALGRRIAFLATKITASDSIGTRYDALEKFETLLKGRATMQTLLSVAETVANNTVNKAGNAFGLLENLTRRKFTLEELDGLPAERLARIRERVGNEEFGAQYYFDKILKSEKFRLGMLEQLETVVCGVPEGPRAHMLFRLSNLLEESANPETDVRAFAESLGRK